MSKKNAYYFWIIFLLYFSNVWSQDVKWYVSLAEEQIKSEDHGIPRVLFVEQVEDGFVVLREQVYRNFKRRKFILEKLDVSLQSKHQEDVTELLDEQNYEIQEVLRLKDRLLLVSTSYRREDKKRAFYIQELYYETAKVGERYEIYRVEIDNNAFYRLELEHSPDEAFLIFSIIPHKRTPLIRKQENDFREMVILNRDLTVFENIGRLNMRVDKIDFMVERAIINDNGTLFFLGKKIPDKKSEEVDFYLLRYFSKTLESSRVSFANGQVKQARLEFNNDGNILFLGYFTESKRFNPGVGVISTVFNAETLKSDVIHHELIRNDIMMVGLPERQKRKWQREIEAGRDYKLNQDILPLYVFRHPSGQLTMIGEIQYVTLESTSLSQAGAFNRFTYNYEHVFVTRIDQNGKVLHTVKIPKLYRGTVDLVQSFQASMHGEHVNLIFNDNLDNLIFNPRKGTRYVSPRSRFNFLVNYAIDPKGVVKNTALFEYNTAPFSKMEMLNMYTDVAQSSKGSLLCSTSGRMGYFYLLVGNNPEID